jgi:diguanylate cyclase (GGDEF)-like protein
MTGKLLLVVCTLLAIPTAVAPGAPISGASYLAGSTILMVGIWVGSRRCSGAARRAWSLIALAATCWLVGDVLQRIIPPGRVGQVLWPPEVCWLASYPLLIAAVVLMVRARHLSPAILREIHLDVITITAAASVGAWRLLIAPALASGRLDLVTVVSLLYPVGDVALFALAVALLVTPGRRGPPLVLLTGCLGATLVLDGLFALLPKVLPALNIDRLDAMLLVTNSLLAAAALHPARADLVQPPEVLDQPATLHRWRLVILGAALTAVSVAAALPWKAQALDRLVLLTASIVMSATILTRLYGVVRDREQAEARLNHLANHDQLTGLANRSLLVRRLNSALAVPVGGLPRCLVLLYVDLDGFKQVNDTWGHAAGDHVLKIVAGRLRQLTRTGDTVARLGGDEFVVLCLDVAEADAPAMGQRLREVVTDPIPWAGHPTQVGASVGVFSTRRAHLDRPDAPDVDEILRSADVAMYTAKRGGGGVVATCFPPRPSSPRPTTDHARTSNSTMAT